MNKNYGLIVTDIQGCFTTWKNGSLAVPGSDEAYVRSVEVATRLSFSSSGRFQRAETKHRG